MANNKKSPAQQAAKAAAAEQKPAVELPSTEDPNLAKIMTMSKNTGLSGDSKVILANLVQKRYIDNPDIPDAIKGGANVIADALIGDVIVTNIVEGNQIFAMIIRRDETRYLAIREMLSAQGITLPEFKMLPAPTEAQAAAAGVKFLPTETAVVTVTAEDVSDEAKKAKKAEKKIEETNPTTNPAEIENEKQLAASLSNLLTSGTEKLDVRVQKVINFYRGYLTIQANKAEDKEAALAEVKALSRSAMLEKISSIVGPCPFAFRGAAHMLITRLASTGTIIVPFCLYRRTANDTNNKNPLEDSFVADITRILTTWSCDAEIANRRRTIAEMERLVRAKENLINTSKDTAEVKTAKAAIKTFNEEIEKKNSEIAYYSKMLELITSPSLEDIDNLIENYHADAESDAYKSAHLIVDTIMKTYYKGVDASTLDEASMLNNVQQRAGIIVNMFRSPLSQSISYTESNITEMQPASSEKTKESANGEEAKN